MTIVESTVWIDALRGTANRQTLWLSRNLDEEELALTDLILCEVLQGVGDAKRFRQARDYLRKFIICNTGGADLAIASAENYRWLRAKGVTIRSTIDCVIATFCIREGHALLHNDRDFDPFERYLGLKVIHP